MTRTESWPSDLDARAAADMRSSSRPRSVFGFIAECEDARRAALAADRTRTVEVIRDVLVESARSVGMPVERLLNGGKRCGAITEARRVTATKLSALGLSSREIAASLGMNHESVRYLLGWRRPKDREQMELKERP